MKVNSCLINKWVLDNNYTISKLCKDINISYQAFHLILKGIRTPSVETLYSLHKIFNIHMEDILNTDNNK